MATDFRSIPIIDISPLLVNSDNPCIDQDSAVCKVVNQLDQACREAGFFYVKGHGIPDTLMNEVKNLAHKFFDLPYEEKLKIKMTANAGYRGYQRIGKNITKGVPDMHEAIDCYREMNSWMYGSLGKPMEGCNQWPLNPQNFKQVMEEYIELCMDLSRKIIRGISLAQVGVADAMEGEIAEDAFWVLRIIGYPPMKTQDLTKNAAVGCGAHTDYDPNAN